MRIHGRHGEVALTDSSPAVVLGSISKWNMSQARDYVNVTAFGDPNKVWIPGLKDISGQISFFHDLEDGSPSSGESEALFLATEGDVPVELRLTPSTLAPTHNWEGPAYLDLSNIDVDVNGAVTGTSTFKASGAWSRN